MEYEFPGYRKQLTSKGSEFWVHACGATRFQVIKSLESGQSPQSKVDNNRDASEVPENTS